MSDEKEKEHVGTLKDAFMAISSEVSSEIKENFDAELDGLIANGEARFERIRRVDPKAKFDLINEARRELGLWKKEKEKVKTYDEYIKYYEANRSNDSLKPATKVAFFGLIPLTHNTVESFYNICLRAGITKGAVALRNNKSKVTILGVTPQCLLIVKYSKEDSEKRKKGTVGLNPVQFTVVPQ